MPTSTVTFFFPYAVRGTKCPMLGPGGPVNDCKVDVAAKTTTENEIHKEKREIPVTLQNSSEAGMAPG